MDIKHGFNWPGLKWYFREYQTERRYKAWNNVLRKNSLAGILLLALFMVISAIAIGVIVYGIDSVMPGANAFHDFRHFIGMPCH